MLWGGGRESRTVLLDRAGIRGLPLQLESLRHLPDALLHPRVLQLGELVVDLRLLFRVAPSLNLVKPGPVPR